MTKTIYLVMMASMQISALLAFIMYVNKSGTAWQRQGRKQSDEVFKRHHIDITVKQYNSIRTCLISFLIIYSVYRMLLDNQVKVIAFILIGLLYYVTSLEKSSLSSSLSIVSSVFNKIEQSLKKNNEFINEMK